MLIIAESLPRSIGYAVACHAWGRQVCQGSGSLNGPELPSIITPMISDLDIFRSANVLVKHHGEDAPVEAAMRADAVLERGDEARVTPTSGSW